ncbi:hypothetical protein [Umezawaea sp.]
MPRAGLSRGTVSCQHLSRICTKIRVSNRPALAARVVQHAPAHLRRA